MFRPKSAAAAVALHGARHNTKSGSKIKTNKTNNPLHPKRQHARATFILEAVGAGREGVSSKQKHKNLQTDGCDAFSRFFVRERH